MGRTGYHTLVWHLAAAALLLALGPPALADAPPPRPAWLDDFRGAWANQSPCRSPNDFMWIYDRRTASFPHTSDLEHARECRILSTRGRAPSFEVTLSCNYLWSERRLPRRFTVTHRLTLIDGGWSMRAEVPASGGEVARDVELFRCRGARDPEPMLRCLSPDARTVPCEP